MGKLLITLTIFFIYISSAYSQSVYKNGSIEFIDRFSIGAGLGAQAPIGKYPTLKESAVIGNLFLQFEYSEGLFTTMNASIEDRNTGTGFVSYLSSGTRFSLLNYENTLYPYIETELGFYFVNVQFFDWGFEDPKSNSEPGNPLFGVNIGTGLDLRLSPLATVDINVKFHSFNMNDKKNFFTFLSILKFNL